MEIKLKDNNIRNSDIYEKKNRFYEDTANRIAINNWNCTGNAVR